MIVRLLTRPETGRAALLLLVGVAMPTLAAAGVLPQSSSYTTGEPTQGASSPSIITPSEKLNWHGDATAPDISGVWVLVDAPAISGSKEGWQPWAPPLKATFAEMWKKRVADAQAGKRTDDPVRGCLPPGMPRFITGTNGPMLIVQTKGRVLLYRDGIPVRRIWLNAAARPAAKDLESFSNGNAIGHYAGLDLVTEVIGIKDQPIDSTGVPHSDDLKIVERYHRVDAKTLRVTVTLTDPTAYTRSLTSSVTYRLLDDPAWEPQEFLCTPITNFHPEKYVR
ncbi:hypothetical protein ACVWYO_004768 [Sphingomonas sp. UYP23]